MLPGRYPDETVASALNYHIYKPVPNKKYLYKILQNVWLSHLIYFFPITKTF